MRYYIIFLLLLSKKEFCTSQLVFPFLLMNNGSIPDTNTFWKEYDFIIIGSGSGGSVMANRLSEIENWSVLLLEVGKEENIITDIPFAAGFTQITSYNWGYKADPMKNACLGYQGGVCAWPRGRALGGTSVINYLIYTRGNRKDYDNWEKLGNSGWSYRDVLPYFKKSENVKIPSLKTSPYHGTSGPVDNDHASYISPLFTSFIEAGKNMGYRHTDPNGVSQLGFSLAQATLRDGKRCSAAKAYLKSVSDRPNLHISMNSWVTKILIDPQTKTAYGVEFLKNKKRYYIRAKKEVILSAGSIASPQLLMLSGVGPKEHLKEMDIPVIQDLRVGYNLQDHPQLSGLTFTVQKPVTLLEKDFRDPIIPLEYFLRGKGPLTVPGGAEGIAFIKTNTTFTPADYPDIELVMGASSLGAISPAAATTLFGFKEEFIRKTYASIQGKHAFVIVPILLRPKSRGRIYLKSKNPFHWPHMEGNVFNDPDDSVVLRDGIKAAIRIVESKSFQRFGAKLYDTPFHGCEHLTFRSDAYWDCCIKQIGSTLHHQCGTCKMGPQSDPKAVVNPQLQVYGIKNLRVVDASIMPEIPASHPNGVIFMIGEKAADMVKKHWSNEIR